MSAPPGWYPDPTDSRQLRWFDGRMWGHATHPWVHLQDAQPLGGLPPGWTPPPPTGDAPTPRAAQPVRAGVLIGVGVAVMAALVVLAAIGFSGLLSRADVPDAEPLPGAAAPDPAAVTRRLAAEAAPGAAAAGWEHLGTDELSCMAGRVVDELGARRAGQLRWDALWSPGRAEQLHPAHFDALEGCVEVPAWLVELVDDGGFDPAELACFEQSLRADDHHLEVARDVLEAGTPAPAAHRFAASGCGDDGTRRRAGMVAGLFDMGTSVSVAIHLAAQEAAPDGAGRPLDDGRVDLRAVWAQLDADVGGVELTGSGIELGWEGDGPAVCVLADGDDDVAAAARQAPGVVAGRCPR